jgi:hypothetical protein
MSEPTQTTLMARAREAAGRGEWRRAHELLIEADASILEGEPLRRPAAVRVITAKREGAAGLTCR